MIQKRKDKVLSTLISLALVMGTCFPTFAFVSAANANEAPEDMIEAVEVSDDIAAGDETDDAAADATADTAVDSTADSQEEDGDMEDEESVPESQPATASVVDDEPQVQTLAARTAAVEMPTADNRLAGDIDNFSLSNPDGNMISFFDMDGKHNAYIAIYKNDEHVGDVDCHYAAGVCGADFNLDDYSLKNGDIIRLDHVTDTQQTTYTAYVYYVGKEDDGFLSMTSGRYTLEQVSDKQYDSDEIAFTFETKDDALVLSYTIGGNCDFETSGYCPSIIQVSSIYDVPQNGDKPSYWYPDLAKLSIKLPTEPGEYLFYVVMCYDGICDGTHFGCYKLTVGEEEEAGDETGTYRVIAETDNYLLARPADVVPDFNDASYVVHDAILDGFNLDTDRPFGSFFTIEDDELRYWTRNALVDVNMVIDGVDYGRVKADGSSTLTVDLSTFAPGTYDVKFYLSGDDPATAITVATLEKKNPSLIEWTIDTINEGKKTQSTQIELPEGTIPVEGTDFTVPEKSNKTASVEIDEDTHTVTITYTYIMVDWTVIIEYSDNKEDPKSNIIAVPITEVFILNKNDSGLGYPSKYSSEYGHCSGYTSLSNVKGYTLSGVVDDSSHTVTITYTQNMTTWTINTDGVESTITLPEGDKPVEGTDFTVPERYGHTPVVEIDKDAHTVTITYISNLVDWTIRYLYPDGTESTVNSSVITGTQPELNIKDIDGYTSHTEINELTNTITVSYTRNMVEWSIVVDGVEVNAISVPQNDIPQRDVDFTVEERPRYTAVVSIDEQGKAVRITYTQNMTTWTITTDGVENTIELPEGANPEQDKDFTVPSKDGYTPNVEIDADEHTVTITYTQNTVEWTIDIDGDESTIQLPEGDKPIEGTNFTVPARDGYTPAVSIDEDSRTVMITYTKDETPEQPLPPVIPIVPGDDDVVLPPSLGDGNGDNIGGDDNTGNTGSNDKLVETGKPSVPEQNIDSNKTPEANVSAPAPAPVADATTDASDDEIAPQNASDASTSDNGDNNVTDADNDDDKATDKTDADTTIPEDDIPLTGEENSADNGIMGWVIGGTGGAMLLVGLIWFIAWRRGKWTIMSENLPDELCWSTKIKCRKGDESIEKNLEDFEIPVVPGYVVSQRFIDEDEREVIYFYIAQ